MSEISFNSLVFYQGIDSITYARHETASAMPERGAAPPPDMGVRAELDILLRQPSMDQRLDSALRPQLANRDLLSPGGFHEGLDKTSKNLQQAMENSRDSADLARALVVLDEEAGLRGLSQTYRCALFKA